MARASIPVDLFNPGQVFACMGFLEVADILLGPAEGGFDWTSRSQTFFEIRAAGDGNPFAAVLETLGTARLRCLVPRGYSTSPESNAVATTKRQRETTPSRQQPNSRAGEPPVCEVDTFPAAKADSFALPLRLECGGGDVYITHWCDASSRNPFKLFAGQQRSAAIAQQMCSAIRELWEGRREELVRDPLAVTTALGGSSFKFDARKAWTTIDAGYSPDEQAHAVEASPIVEILAAIGLEHARPDEFQTRRVRYGVWSGSLRPVLARAALGGVRVGVPIRIFRFTLDLAGKNKVVTFAQEEAGL